MRIKLLMLGNDPASLIADGQLLRDRGILVFTAFNLSNLYELISEIKPDLIYFGPHKMNTQMTDTYNSLIGGINFINLPVVFTLSDDDVYLVTRKRTEMKEKRTMIADNIIGAIKMALNNSRHGHKKSRKISSPDTSITMPLKKWPATISIKNC